MSAAYPIAAIPEPYQILGLRLKPLCLGHYLHMERFGVAFASSEIVPVSLEDLVVGVAICSMTYEGFLEFIDKPESKDELESWGARCHEFDFVEKVKLFQQYMIDGSKQPVVAYESQGKTSGAHWVQCIQNGLIELGYTPSEALNLPLTKAFSDYFKSAESKGVLTILTPEMAALLESTELEEVACPS